MSSKHIIIRGAREHNLKNVDVDIERDKLVVITGVSGSGKSSLAFDTIYAEGQRRYMESLSAYARQFLGRMEKPDVDMIDGLSPAISIDQKGSVKNPRSTVGTITEIYDYLRVLFARTGHPHCPNCGREIAAQTPQQIVDAVMRIPENTKVMIMSPIVKDRKGEHREIFAGLRKNGYARVRVDGKIISLDEEIELDKQKKHRIDVVIDRLIITKDEDISRVANSVETALKLSDGIVLVSEIDGEEHLYSDKFACVECGISVGEIEPRSFSFNSPHGACPACTGLGFRMDFDVDLIIPDKSLSISEGAIYPYHGQNMAMAQIYELADLYGESVDKPFSKLSKEFLQVLLYGENPNHGYYRNKFGRLRMRGYGFEGVIPRLDRLYKDTESQLVREQIEAYQVANICPECNGKRLRPEILKVTIGDKNIIDVSNLSVTDFRKWVDMLKSEHSVYTETEKMIAHDVLKEITARLKFLEDVGLEYLTMHRSSATLSGGEAQRIRLATQIGSGLVGVLYICDEPTIGLHPSDDYRLIGTLHRLRDLGNSVIVVEHDEAIMRAADCIIDMGPRAGIYGGEVVAVGTVDEIMKNEKSLTGAYLSGRKQIPVPKKRRKGNGHSIVIKGARQNNLKNIDVKIDLGKMVCVTGVSGSGKSSLINEILQKALSKYFYRSKERPGDHDSIEGLENLDKVINIDQSPIGRTPRSNPATYTGMFTPIRELFASMPEAKARGYTAGRFSFNVKGGRCEACHGDGYNQIEMQFLADVTVPCEVCHGKRYDREVLEVMFKGKNIADVLDMSVDEAMSLFENQPRIYSKLKTLSDVGLGYIKLGQPATTMSGGEAQRVKLSTELSKRATGKTIYILDEPTTGLSFADVDALLIVLQRLVDAGNSIVLIEHNLDIIKSSDWIIDLGPKAGDKGGKVVAEGTPEQIAKNPKSVTGKFLKPVLGIKD
jgi:excinuclease ABC subunit A